MAKRKQQQQKKVKGAQGKKVVVRLPRGGSALVAAEMMRRYLQLLEDPCTGPLVHAPGSSSGGIVTRFESDFIFGNEATTTCGALLFTPGAYTNNASANPGYLGFVSTADATAANASQNGQNTILPGWSYLNANASSYRCIAACAQVYWPGSELNRQGVVSGAQATGGLLLQGNPYKVADLRSASPIVERMPSDFMEIKWAPSHADGLFLNPASTVSQGGSLDAHSSILLTFAGIPVSTGVRIRLVAVVEWQPSRSGLNLASNVADSDPSSMQKARVMLDRANPGWWHRAGQAAYHFLSGATVAYAAQRANNFPRVEL